MRFSSAAPILIFMATQTRLTKVQRREIDAAVGSEVTCAPNTAEALRVKGRVSPVLRRFSLKQQAPHGTWFNRQFVVCALMHGPW